MRLALLLSVLALAACTRNPPALTGGNATAQLGGIGRFVGSQDKPATSATLTQSANPATVSTQTVERVESQQTAAPVASVRVTETPHQAGGYVRVTEQFAAPAILSHTITEKTGTAIGAAQRDESRSIEAKLASFRPVQFAGVALMLLAAAMFHPVVRVAVGAGKEMQMATAAIGAALVFGPALIVGHEHLFLGVGVVLLVGAWLAFRLSYKSGALDAVSLPGKKPRGPA